MCDGTLLAMDHVFRETLELDRNDTSWLLSCYLTDVTLRLRIQHDHAAEFDSADHIFFEVKLHEAETFIPLGHTILEPALFTPEWCESNEMPCVCGVPAAYRPSLVQMVSRWGELRTLSMFRPTVAGTPFQETARTRHACGRRHAQQDD